MTKHTVYDLEGLGGKHQERLDAFHMEVSEELKAIQEDNEKYGLRIGDSETGAGGFSGDEVIPAGTRIAYLIASIMPIMHFKRRPESKRDRRYSFVKKWMGTERWFDGKTMLKKHRKPWNVSFFNHSCNPNCKMVWNEKTKGSLLVLTTIKDIPPNTQLTSDYNNGKRSGYMTPVSRLIKEGVPKEDIVDCACAYPVKCPKKCGFDKLAMERSIARPVLKIKKIVKKALKKPVVKPA